ncbi:hypothetical protein LCGC14_1231950 [marine sediment metagenome]|uniref:Sodium:proton antiporter n=2 Tax=root TaxID=1 RepID=A0A831VNX2_9FLAO|nr:sodium:proton antiporter [Pricia sp.]HEA21391.1 sodium:proton antiporter [Pricia antarctica]
MQSYHLILLAFGLATVLMAYVPILSEKLKITYTLPMLIVGVIIYHIGTPINWPDPFWEHEWVKVVTELIVILSLMGAGLKIGLRYGKNHWKQPLRLLHTAMPLYMIAIFVGSSLFLGLDGPSSLLLAAVCAPTDPVMATDMQLENDGSDGKRNTGLKYLLTSEAGLNDGMAFPFVYLAILWSTADNFGNVDLWEWSYFYLFFKIITGIVIGTLFGYLYSLSVQWFDTMSMDKTLSGFVAIALAVASFGLAEAAESYGFLSVFFTGLFAQYHNHKTSKDSPKGEMLFFTEETEKLLMVVWILLFGGFLATGILSKVDYIGVIAAIVIVLVLRPLTAIVSLIGTTYSKRKKWAISFFGIKGIGSFFYLAYALGEGHFSSPVKVYALVSWVVLISIVVHGLTGPRVISYFKRNDPG